MTSNNRLESLLERIEPFTRITNPEPIRQQALSMYRELISKDLKDINLVTYEQRYTDLVSSSNLH